MLRWLILFVTFAAWSSSLSLVYLYCRPAPIPPEALANQQTLDFIFSENVSKYSAWRVYLNPADLRASGSETEAQNGPLTPRDPSVALMELLAVGQGAEPGEIDVGFMVSTIKKRDPSTAEQATAMKVQIPPGVASGLISLLSPLLIDVRSNISVDDGILDCFMRASMGSRIEVQANGFRDHNKLRITQTCFDQDRPIGEQSLELPAHDLSAPQVSPAPLNDRPPLQLGNSWSVLLLDAGRNGQQPRILHTRVAVKEKIKMRYHGREVDAFLAEADVDGGICLGWYLASGRLLKQHFRYANILNVTLIRSETDDPDPALPEPGWGKIFPKREKLDSPRSLENRLGS